MNPLAQLVAVLQKDLLVEWRGRARIVALFCFAFTLLLVFSFAVGADIAVMRSHASAYLWLALLLCSTLLMTGSMQVETESGALESLVLAPVAPAAIFYGKAIANGLQLLMVGLISLPPTLVLCDAGLKESGLSLLVVMLAGCLGIAGPGTFYAALTARMASRQLLLPLLLFPLLMPCLLAAVKATSLLLQGDAMGQVGSWLGLLLAFDLLYWSVGGALFSKVIET